MKIKNLNYILPNQRQLFNHLNLAFKDDKINIIIGPNGVGKTTLLDFIAGLHRPKGAQFLGFPSSNKVAYQLQGVPFIAEVSVFSTMKMVMDIENPKNHFQKIDLPSELKKVADTPYGKLSGGQRRIVVLDIISRLNRDLYLFDEPESGLDPKMSKKAIQKIQSLNRTGKKIIMTSHTFQNIDPKNNRFSIHFLKQGQIRFSGTPAEFLASRKTNNLIDAYINTDNHTF